VLLVIRFNCLDFGEMETGKEVLAHYIHQHQAPQMAPFCGKSKLCCGISENYA